MGGFTNIPKLKTNLGTEGTGYRIALFNEAGELVGYMEIGSGFVPLSGGVMTGDIEFLDYGKGLKQVFEADSIETILQFNEDEGLFIQSVLFDNLIDRNEIRRSNIFVSSNASGFNYKDSGGVVNLIVSESGLNLQNSFAGSKGFLGATFFNKQNDPNAFAQLGDIAVVNETATPLSLATLNSTYATKGNGFKVICPNINLIYIKSSLTTWESFSSTTVV